MLRLLYYCNYLIFLFLNMYKVLHVIINSTKAKAKTKTTTTTTTKKKQQKRKRNKINVKLFKFNIKHAIVNILSIAQ